jgi:hypothetical protein
VSVKEVGPHVRLAVLTFRAANLTRILCVFLAHSALLLLVSRLLRLIGRLVTRVIAGESFIGKALSTRNLMVDSIRCESHVN